MKPGIHPELPIDAYHLSEGISKTGLCLFSIAPLLYKFRSSASKAESRPLSIGKAVHAMMDGSFDQHFVVGPEVKSRAEKIWRDFAKSHEGNEILRPVDAKLVRDMQGSLLSFSPTRELLAGPGRFESSLYWEDTQTQALCKCRPDWISADFKTVIDFKTSADAAHGAFQKSAYAHQYFVSAAHTLDGIKAVTGILPERYIFLVVQSSPPHLTAAYEATADELALGRDFIRRSLLRYSRCQETDFWPGLPAEILPLGLPRWARSEIESETTDDSIAIETTEPANWWE